MKFIKIKLSNPAIKVISLFAPDKILLKVERKKKVKYYASIKAYCIENKISVDSMWRRDLPLTENGVTFSNIKLSEIK